MTLNENATINEWCENDFTANYYYWQNYGREKVVPIRLKNLSNIFETLQKHNVQAWLFGKTLFDIVKHEKLLDNPGDDIGVWKDKWVKTENSIISDLKSIGFEIIRNNEEVLSVIRDYRYADICKFQKNENAAGYGHNRFSSEYFSPLMEKSCSGLVFPIPGQSEQLLAEMYKPVRFHFIKRVYGRLFTQKALKKLFNLFILKCIFRSPHGLKKIIIKFLYFSKMEYKEISKDCFCNLWVEPEHSYNWKWRKPHLDIVTHGGENKKICDIINYFSMDNAMENCSQAIIETDTARPFFPPVNWDHKFWQSGNNYFFYCLKYQFRKNVVSHKNANEYIQMNTRPHLYTASYYESLPEMSDHEIELFLKKYPFEIMNDAIVSGKHRVFAMIGRLIEKKRYIPFWALVHKSVKK